MTCKGVIPDTFIACGEGGNFCSSECHFDDLVRRARELPPMTEEQVKEQRASFAYGNLALMREYRDASPEKLEALRQMCRKAAGL